MRTERLFYQNVGFVFQISLCIVWIHNDSMYVRFGGIRNTKTWTKSNRRTVLTQFCVQQTLVHLPLSR